MATAAVGSTGTGWSAAEWGTRVRRWLAVLPLAGLCAGLLAQALGRPDFAMAAWAFATLAVLAVLLTQVVTSLARGDVGLDLVALLSMGGALLLGQTLAGAVIALMYAGGQSLEAYATGRAGAAMTALIARQPRTALREEGGVLQEVALAALVPGDRILVRVGDVVPVDGWVAAGRAVLDRSSLTGEALPVTLKANEPVLSGTVNAGTPFTLLAERPAAESTYAGIVRLVEAARAQKAPMARLADRYGLGFLALTLALAGGAWAATGDPIRALAVLVVATPCPLILAVPVALVSGLSRAAGIGVLIKGGGALEMLAQVRVLVIDKTGTLTRGSARLAALRTLGAHGEAEVLRLAASVDQASGHPVARALVEEARGRGLILPQPSMVAESPGEGASGRVEGRLVIVGGARLMRRHGIVFPPAAGPRQAAAAASTVLVAVDGTPAAVLDFADPLRTDGGRALMDLRACGITRVVLATGDRRGVAEALVAGLPVDAIVADLDPAAKTGTVAAERRNGLVMMVGDGVNDAPALAAADLGVALGARGAAAAAEAADVVLLVDSLAPLPQAIHIAKRARAIALQSVWIGLGLSLAGMVAAALGHLSPLQGALLQEAIDVAVILNAMRVLGGPRDGREPTAEAVGHP
ncbi:copper-exporting P-type ATPase A [Methylobacterium phyllosphaerae]|uniref:P-type Zn(2+) transporter n=1 Tax=Methylobacterium phyllosphaerae TaxID=418223 RepID=A0AAE8L9X9_9HYPH|nr:heavy metal translocating P-type ATPase [Methylobacterium phyllosphaerae]APT32782.1 copper-exporting P-type ATPase A [Methylobacterium phyllosphaerae]SFH78229.1 ATPase, P-type (transporting), HAD superfamily, subfamily IC/heavy metal translocating P-type ATPase [Methylobacterium phyllosphaerae]